MTRVLWYSRQKGPGGPLREVRLACTADARDRSAGPSTSTNSR